MDSNILWAAQAQPQIQIPGQAMSSEASVAPGMEAGDWRTQLQADSRQRIVTKMMETLKKHLPFSGQEGLQELKKIAVRFEEKIYTAATSQSDYLRKISLKMLTMQTKSRNPIVNSLQPNAVGSSEIPQIQTSGSLLQPYTAINQQLQSQRAIPEVPLTEVQIPGGAAVAPVMEVGDWRTQLGADPRRRLVNKIMETLKKHLPFSEFGREELEKEAVKLEEKIFNTAKSQSDYLRKISLKMLALETKSQNPTANSRRHRTTSRRGLKSSTSR